MKKNDIISGTVIGVIGLLFFLFSFRIQKTTSDILGSRFFPQLAAVLLMVLSAVQIGKAALYGRNPEGKTAGEEGMGKGRSVSIPLLLTTAALFLYYFLVLGIGFTPTSVLYLLFTSFVLMSESDRKNRKLLILVLAVSVLLPVFLDTVFYQVFRIKLPTGSLFR